MKYQDKFVGSQGEIFTQMKELPKQFMQNTIVVESERVVIPKDKELVYKIKYENDELEGSLAIKVSWMNTDAEEEDEEEEEQDEEEED